jgi:hypothetical protein
MGVRNSNFAAIKAAPPNLLLFLGWVGCRDQSLGTMAGQRRAMFVLRTAFFIGRSSSGLECLRDRYRDLTYVFIFLSCRGFSPTLPRGEDCLQEAT